MQNPEKKELIPPTLFLIIVIICSISILLFLYPHIKNIIIATLLLIKAFFSIFTLNFTGFKYYIYFAIQAIQNNPIPNLKEIIYHLDPPLWITGFLLSVPFIIYYINKILFSSSITEEDLIENYKNKSLIDILKEYKIDPKILEEKDYYEIALKFSETVKKNGNIPPNIISRKINDKTLKEVINHYDRVLKYKERLTKITDKKIILEYIRENLQETSEENEEY